jgi:prepilin-type N-terminal cleavage/methylation domain-containing protein
MKSRRAFSLVEVLVVAAIVAVLAALALPGLQFAQLYAKKAGCTSNMRQVGMAMMLYASENNMQLPPRSTGNDPSTGQPVDKWPKLLTEGYLKSTEVYVDPRDPEAAAKTPQELVSNDHNNTSFFFNGFNDLGAFDDPTICANLTRMEKPGSVILLAQRKLGKDGYYMDFAEGPAGNQNDVLDKTAYGKGAVYVFSDGSARFMLKSEYDDHMWLANPDYVIPSF